MQISRHDHRVLYDFYRQCQASTEPVLDLEGARYKIVRHHDGDFTVIQLERAAKKLETFFNRAPATAGHAGTTIAAILNDPRKHADFQLPVDRHYQGICFSGGGAKGFGYLGIVDELGHEQIRHVQQVSGASAGALTAIAFAIGLSADELRAAFKDQPATLKQKVLEQSLRAKILYALKRAPYLTHLPDIIGAQASDGDWDAKIESITFAQLAALKDRVGDTPAAQGTLKALFISASLIDKKHNLTSEVKLSSDTTPDMPIYKAGLASAALPVLLKPVAASLAEANLPPQFPNKNGMVKLRDGGIHNNLPFRYLTQAQSNLILSFDGNERIHEKPLSFGEKIKQWLCDEPVYKRRRADHLLAERYGVHYLQPEVALTDTKKARANLAHISHRCARDFHYYRRQQSETPSVEMHDIAQEDLELNRRKYG
ncbi:patatin-like phospholipase family protein [Paludibacterium sp.]|uniref:patatin-like phospholipase family protein n=1 Tax=Paludibacterium sp. TaxID=1917523 RepID=UPI0025F1F04E|nr:patatin-like phospholipase family protein [Paludibacterium sp.]MBV8648184.1 patatin-like phospholipase family protein [Paludibacterium sp.]